jgi:hypothetical protein
VCVDQLRTKRRRVRPRLAPKALSSPEAFELFSGGVKKRDIGSQSSAGRTTQEEKKAELINVWRKYVKMPAATQEALLEAIDPLVIAAVGRANRGRLDHSLAQDAMQEVRLELVPQGFLLASARLRDLSSAAEELGWPNALAEQIQRTMTNLVYMVAQWEVATLVRSEMRHQSRNRAWQPNEGSDGEGGDDLLEREMLYQNNLGQIVRECGYNKEEGEAIAEYFGGLISQTELGRKLGVQQAAVSKRLRAIRRALSRLGRDRDEEFSFGGRSKRFLTKR